MSITHLALIKDIDSFFLAHTCKAITGTYIQSAKQAWDLLASHLTLNPPLQRLTPAKNKVKKAG